MLVPLEPCEYVRVMPLFDAYRYLRPAIYAVLEGTQPGEVLVDNRAAPRSAVLWSDFLYLAGDANNEAFNAAFRTRLIEEAAPTRQHLLLYGSNEIWHAFLDGLVAPLGGRRLERSLFSFDPDRYRRCSLAYSSTLPNGFQLKRLDARMALEVGGIPELWGSVEQFLAYGWGYCVLQGDAFVSSSQTVFLGDGRAEIGVGTREPYRRRGFARAVVCATIDECLRRGILPEWGCVYNPPSGALAESLGFAPLPSAAFFYAPGERPQG